MGDEEEGGDYFQTTENESWGGRMGKSMSGLCIGPLLMTASIAVLFWNEGRNVHRIKDLQETQRLVSSLSDSSVIDNSFEAKLIHVSGKVTTDAYLYDQDFGVSQDAIKLQRQVETYQWVEDVDSTTKKNAGGSTTTTKTYSYQKEWSRDLINSYNFHTPDNHGNPDELLFEEQTLTAEDVMLGAFELSDSIVGSMNWYSQVTGLSLDNAAQGANGETVSLVNNAFYYGNNPSSPAVGDTQVKFYSVPTGKISIIAEQSGGTFAPYYTSRGGKVMLVEKGLVSAGEMIEHAAMANRMMTWVLRAVGVAMSYFGFTMLFEPLMTFSDVIPFVGNILEKGVVPCLALVVASTISITVIAIAWLFYRPLIGIGLLMVVGGIVYFVMKRAKQNKQNQNQAYGGGPPPEQQQYGTEQPQQQQQYGQQFPEKQSGYTPQQQNYQQNATAPFAQALDIPAPQEQQYQQQQYPPATAPHVVQATLVEPEINTNQPYVPAVFKPFG